jgi:ElaB/YqjD/DUF883 family membrane-anchored ribosome-binding protein
VIAELRFDLSSVENSLSRLTNNSEDGFKKVRERFEEDFKRVAADMKGQTDQIGSLGQTLRARAQVAEEQIATLKQDATAKGLLIDKLAQ